MVLSLSSKAKEKIRLCNLCLTKRTKLQNCSSCSYLFNFFQLLHGSSTTSCSPKLLSGELIMHSVSTCTHLNFVAFNFIWGGGGVSCVYQNSLQIMEDLKKKKKAQPKNGNFLLIFPVIATKRTCNWSLLWYHLLKAGRLHLQQGNVAFDIFSFQGGCVPKLVQLSEFKTTSSKTWHAEHSFLEVGAWLAGK